jgi:hypothetical protein
MPLVNRLVVGLAGLLTAAGVNAANCSSNLLVDNFTKWTSGVNNLDWQNGGRSCSPLGEPADAGLTDVCR